MAYQLLHNTPTANAISWVDAHIVYDGQDYSIANGSTTDKYVFWVRTSPNVFQTTNQYPNALLPEDAIVFINNLGVGLSVLESSVIDGSVVIPGTIQASALAAESVSADKIVAGAITANKIAVNAVTADKIAANSITANKIAAGSITAEKLAAGSISAEKISVGYAGNLLSGSYWPNASSVSNLSVSQNTTGLAATIQWLDDTSPFSMGETVRLMVDGTPPAASVVEVGIDEKVALQGGARYEASGYFGSIGASAQVVIRFYTSSDVYISEAIGTPVSTPSSKLMSSYTRSFVFDSAPPNAASGRVFIRSVYDGVTANPDVFFMRVLLGETTSGATEPSPWSAAGMRQTVIDGDSITTGTINASKLNITDLSGITTNLGAMTAGSLTLDNAGFIRAGAIDYEMGAGVWMGYNLGTYKFRMVGATGKYLKFNGNDIELNGKFIGDVNITGGSLNVNNKFIVNEAGEMTALSGTYGGQLMAGVLDFSQLDGVRNTYLTPGIYTITVPDGKTTMRATLCAASGAGGGAGNVNAAGGGGGGSTGVQVVTVNGLASGTTYTLIIGAKGIRGDRAPWGGDYMNRGNPGGDGGDTSISGLITCVGGKGGGGGGTLPSGTIPGGAAGTNGRPGQATDGSGAGGPGGLAGDGISIISGCKGGDGGHARPNENTAQDGQDGFAYIEFFNPNSVVLQTTYSELITKLQQQGIQTP